MSWLRIDDGFASHPKIAALTDRQLRVWMRVLCYCARHQDPSVDTIAVNEVKGLTWKVVEGFQRVGLLDKVGEHLEVHDWAKYLPKDLTGAERQARWRARQSSETVTDSVTPPVIESLPRAGARAPVPVPSRPVTQKKPPATAAPPRERDEVWDTLENLFGRVAPKTNAHQKRNKAAADLKRMGASAEGVRAAFKAWPALFEAATCTDIALATHYVQLAGTGIGDTRPLWERKSA